MNPDQWGYLAEGNHHVILKYLCPDYTSQFAGKILRIAKAGCESCSGMHETFTSNVMEPVFSRKYLCRPQPVLLHAEFLILIAEKIECERPEGRRDKSLPRADCSGLLEPNLTIYLGPCPDSCGSPLGSTVCVEVKVKCGMYPCSSLLDEDDFDIKMNNTKFSFMQLVKCAQNRDGAIAPWGAHIRSVSDYNPADICSGNRDSVRKACNSLVQSPQNNFIVYKNGAPVYGLKHISKDGWLGACKDFFGSQDLSNDICETLFLEVISDALCREDALRRLQCMQALDVLDVHGAYAVLCQLGRLLEGDLDKAVNLVDDCICSHTVCADIFDIIRPRLSCSTEKMPKFQFSLNRQPPFLNELIVINGAELLLADVFEIEINMIRDLRDFLSPTQHRSMNVHRKKGT